jgi:hypothetical protein
MVPLEILNEISPLVEESDRVRYEEIVALFTSPRRFPMGSEESHDYNDKVFKSRAEILAILRRAAARRNDERVTKLIHHFEGRET